VVLRHERWWIVNVLFWPHGDDGAIRPLPGERRKAPAKELPESGLVRYWMAQGMPEHVARRYVAELKERAPKKPPGGKKRGR
jgi:hypothetical protein